MTMKNSTDDFNEAGGFLAPDPARLAYIKPMGADEARTLGVIPPGIQLPPGIKFYALYSGDGTRMAVTDNWETAYGAAVQNEFTPLSVH